VTIRRLCTLVTAALLWAIPALADAQQGCASSHLRSRTFEDISVPYAQRVADAIRFYLVVLEPVAPGSVAEIEVLTEPNGAIASFRLVKSQGSAAWEAAVLRALAKADCLPLDVSGKVPEKLYLVFRPQ
jgi:hypothetical protein